MQKRIALHKIRLDVLLWSLRSFAPTPSIRFKVGRGYMYNDRDIEIIKYYYTHFRSKSGKRLRKHKATELEGRLNRSYKSVVVSVCQWRKSGRIDW